MKYHSLFFMFCLLGAFVGIAQQIYIDRGVQVNGLWCFPVHTDETTYRYLPTKTRLSLDDQGRPKFSFMRYMTEKPTEGLSATSITEAGGGGILHFMVHYETPEEQISEAERLLKERFENEAIRIKGPILFDSASYSLVSSILTEDNSPRKKLLSFGQAPVMENSRIALSFEVDPISSKLLLESFKMDTPDVSLNFDLAFSGLTEAYDATLEIDWSEVKKSFNLGAGGNVYFVSADVELGLDELFKNNSIRLITNGDDEQMEGLLQTVYDKLLALMFEPVAPTEVPEAQRGGMMDALNALIGQDGALSSGNTFNFGINASFQMKELRTEGMSRLFFKGRSTVGRHHLLTFNIGNLYDRYGTDTSYFRDVPMWDPAFQQREIFVGIDGELEREFEKLLSSVTISLRKKHNNGHETLQEVFINRDRFQEAESPLSMRYLNHGDSIQTDWMNYEFKTIWKFNGGGTYETDWVDESSAMVNLYVPFKRKQIFLDGDLESLKGHSVRAVSVGIDYPFFDQRKKHQLSIRPTDNLEEKVFEITLPNTEDEIDYSITWFLENEEPIVKQAKDRYGLIFIDELPSNMSQE